MRAHLILAVAALAATAAAAQTPPPGYGAFTRAPTTPTPARLPPADRAGPRDANAGPVNATPFSGTPTGGLGRAGGQISPADRGTTAGRNVLPSLSK